MITPLNETHTANILPLLFSIPKKYARIISETITINALFLLFLLHSVQANASVRNSRLLIIVNSVAQIYLNI